MRPGERGLGRLVQVHARTSPVGGGGALRGGRRSEPRSFYQTNSGAEKWLDVHAAVVDHEDLERPPVVLRGDLAQREQSQPQHQPPQLLPLPPMPPLQPPLLL